MFQKELIPLNSENKERHRKYSGNKKNEFKHVFKIPRMICFIGQKINIIKEVQHPHIKKRCFSPISFLWSKRLLEIKSSLICRSA